MRSRVPDYGTLANGQAVAMNPTEHTLRAIIEANPDAEVVAIGSIGAIVDMPEELGIEARIPQGAKVSVDLVHPTSRAAMVNQFVHVPRGQMTQQLLLGRNAKPRVVYVFDMSDTFHICVLVLAKGAALHPDIKIFANEEREIEPRYSRQMHDRLGNVIAVDPAFPSILGYSAEELLALDIVAPVHEDFKSLTVANWYKAVLKETSRPERWRSRVQTKSGEWIWAEFTVTNHLHDANSPYVLVEMVDVSAEVQALEELYESRELLERLTDILPVGVMYFDRDFKVTYLNDRVFEMFDIERNYNEPADLTRFHKKDRKAVAQAMEGALEGIDSDLTVAVQVSEAHPEQFVSMAIRPLRNRRGEVSGIVVTLQNITAEVIRRQSLERRASYDALTGSLNRESIYQAVRQELEAIGVSSPGVAVLFADVDKLKIINDQLGHAAGDDLLKEVSAAIHSGVRSLDKVGRLGGDEFLILCPDLPSPDQALEIAERITNRVKHISVQNIALGTVTISVGAAWTRRANVAVDEIISRADTEMYSAKRSEDSQPTLAIL